MVPQLAQQQQRQTHRLKHKPLLVKEHLKQLKPLKHLEVEQQQLIPQPPRQPLIPLDQQVQAPVPQVQVQVQVLLHLVQVTMVVDLVVTTVIKTLLYTILNKILCLYQK